MGFGIFFVEDRPCAEIHRGCKDSYGKVVELYHEKRHCVKKIRQMMGVSKPTPYRYVGMEEKG
jgi:hypothetical protein